MSYKDDLRKYTKDGQLTTAELKQLRASRYGSSDKDFARHMQDMARRHDFEIAGERKFDENFINDQLGYQKGYKDRVKALRKQYVEALNEAGTYSTVENKVTDGGFDDWLYDKKQRGVVEALKRGENVGSFQVSSSGYRGTGRPGSDQTVGTVTYYSDAQGGTPQRQGGDGDSYDGFEAREYETDFSDQAWVMEYQEEFADEIDEKYSTKDLEAEVDSIEANSKEPMSLKDTMTKTMGRIKQGGMPKENNRLNKDIKKNADEFKKLAAFKPKPMESPSFKDVTIPIPKSQKALNREKLQRRYKKKQRKGTLGPSGVNYKPKKLSPAFKQPSQKLMMGKNKKKSKFKR